jgi:hypothetical protein
MVPNIPENSRGRKKPKRGRKQRFSPAIFEERFRTIERVFAWEDKFRRLLLRFEHLSQVHYALKTLAYTTINLRLLLSISVGTSNRIMALRARQMLAHLIRGTDK